MVKIMSYSIRLRRFRGTRKRVDRIRFTREDKWYGVLLLLLGLVSVGVGAWLGVHLGN